MWPGNKVNVCVAVNCSDTLHNGILWYTVLYYGTLGCTTMIYCDILWYTVLYYGTLGCTTMIYCDILWYTVLYYGTLGCTTMIYCDILWYTVLYYGIPRFIIQLIYFYNSIFLFPCRAISHDIARVAIARVVIARVVIARALRLYTHDILATSVCFN